MRILSRLALSIMPVVLTGQNVPVLVELFTSQGCSSCPPADQVLARLESSQPVRGAEILVLSEHVDYWNRLGWTDPFSSAQFTERQRQYSLRFARDAYTPQMVVNGVKAFVGSDERTARRAIADAVESASSPVTLHLQLVKVDTGAATVKVDISGGAGTGAIPRDAQLWLAVTESGLSREVRSGENGGRKLSHTGVVRSLLGVKPSSSATQQLKLHPDWKPENLQCIAFVQDRHTLAVLGSARVRLTQSR